MIRLRPLSVVVLTALTLSAAPTEAAPLILNYSGTFGSTSTLDGVAFGADTPFSFQATFDSTPDETFVGGAVAIFSAVVTFDIAGFGTFTSDSTAAVVLQDPRIGGGPSFGAGLSIGGASFSALFSTVTPPFEADAPIPTVFTDFVETGGFLPMTIALAGGAGDLVINDVVGTAAAEITAGVPEPATLMLLGLGVAVGARRWRRRTTTE